MLNWLRKLICHEPEPCPECPPVKDCPECPPIEDCPEPSRNTWCHFSRQEEPAINHAIGFVNKCPDGSTILLAAYAFTVRSLALALIDAKNRGCDVRVIIDNTRSSAQAKMIVHLLRDAGVPLKQDKVPARGPDGKFALEICEHNEGRCPNDPPRYGKIELERNGSAEIKYSYKGSSIHHNKYIVEYREDGTGSVFTGSFNFSSNGQSNFENILITRDDWAVQDYKDNFDENWFDAEHFDYIPKEYIWDTDTESMTDIEAPIITKRNGKLSTHDPYDESEWASQIN